MDLILWRHAEAEDGSPDEARALTAKGIKQAQRMASWLKRRVRGPLTIIASPALRARQTAEAYGEEVQTRDSIGIGASAARILKAAHWPDGDGTVIVVGHQPALGAAAALALTGNAASWPVKKGAVWWLRSKASSPPTVVAVLAPRHARDK
ncbi:MAG TPA: histidine phosphatase family protein [Burkholderiales bacterium]|nr:histidine phosphatase family protein [Burkholderiales bacterium]